MKLKMLLLSAVMTLKVFQCELDLYYLRRAYDTKTVTKEDREIAKHFVKHCTQEFEEILTSSSQPIIVR